MRRATTPSQPQKARPRSVSAAVVVALAIGVGCSPSRDSSTRPPIAPVAKSATAESATAAPRVSMTELSYVLGVKSAAGDATATTPAEYRAWIRARLAEPEIYASLTPRIISSLGGVGIAVVGFLGGPVKSDRGRDFYFHTADKCTDKDLVPVRPWWAPDTEILVARTTTGLSASSASSGRPRVTSRLAEASIPSRSVAAAPT